MRVLSRLLAVLLLCGVVVGGGNGGASARVAQPSDIQPAIVEGFDYPDSDRIFADLGIRLKKGDGHIVLATDCAAQQDLILVWSRIRDDQFCFRTSGRSGSLSLELPQAYAIRASSYPLQAVATVDGQPQSITAAPGEWRGIGEGADPNSGPATLLELRTTHPNPAGIPPTPSDPAYAFVAKIDVGGTRTCTGVLVASRWIATASSCLAEPGQQLAPGLPPRPITVTVGRTTLTSTVGTVASVLEVRPRADRDVVLAKLSWAIPDIAPVPLATSAPGTGEALRIAGFGRTATEWVPDALHVGNPTVAAIAAAGLARAAAAGQADPCKGDAGAPVLRTAGGRTELVAIAATSWQHGCLAETETRQGSGAARLDTLAAWITQQTVPPAPAPVGAWSFDEGSGTTAADSSGNGRNATLQGATAGWGAGRVGKAGVFSGTGHAATAGPVLRTDQSFTVSVWVYLTKNDTWYTAVAQDGNRTAPFVLQYSRSTNKWAFDTIQSDTDGPREIAALSTTVPKLNEWTHLAGIYDAAAHEARLYVNGLREGTAGGVTLWNSDKPFLIGRTRYNGAPVQYFPGSIDDVRAYAQALTDADIRQVREEVPLPVPAGSWNLDEGSGTVAADSSGNGRNATLQDSAAGWGAGRVGKAGVFSGTGHAATAGPVLRTDQSFTVSAWVYLTKNDTWYTAVAQDGNRTAPFVLQYSRSTNKWAFDTIQSDTDGPREIAALSTSEPKLNEWTHLAGVYDAATHEARVYVNGVREGTAGGVTLWNSDKPFLIGRTRYNGTPGQYFLGAIDEVRAYAKGLNDSEVRQLRDETPMPSPVGYWSFNEGTGTTAADSSGNGRNATLQGATAGWGDGRVGKTGVFSGTGHAATAGPVVRTDRSFAVSAWVYLTRNDTWYTAVAQDGNRTAPFVLQYSRSTNKWVFDTIQSDTDGPREIAALSTTVPKLNEWTHLTGVYDAGAHEARVYVNGVCEGTVGGVTLWNSDKPFLIGRTRYNGSPVQYFPGAIDEVRAYDLAISDAEARRIFTGA